MDDSRGYGALAERLKRRCRLFALDVIVLCRRFPRTLDGDVIARQLIRAATGTAANYRAACRSRSRDEFASRISVASEEADEAQLWLDLAIAARILPDEIEVTRLLKEASELTAILTTSRDTAKHNVARHQR